MHEEARELVALLSEECGNSRNEHGKKVLKTELGETEIEVPRDRNGEFSPRVIEKSLSITEQPVSSNKGIKITANIFSFLL